jgi:hypothetical protein
MLLKTHDVQPNHYDTHKRQESAAEQLATLHHRRNSWGGEGLGKYYLIFRVRIELIGLENLVKSARVYLDLKVKQ